MPWAVTSGPFALDSPGAENTTHINVGRARIYELASLSVRLDFREDIGVRPTQAGWHAPRKLMSAKKRTGSDAAPVSLGQTSPAMVLSRPKVLPAATGCVDRPMVPG